MRAALVLAAALGAGCAQEWPGLDPVEHGFGLDERLGLEVFRTAKGLRIASVHQRDGLQIYFEVIGDGWQLRQIDPVSAAIVELPAPPLLPGERINAGRALPPARAVVAAVRDGGAVITAVLDDAGWQTLPALPIAGTTEQLGAILAHHGRIYASFAGRMFVWNGAAWTEPVGPGPVIAAGFDADTQWMLTVEGDSFAAVPVAADGTVGAAVPAPAGAGTPGASAVNGDAASFQLVAGGRLWRFDGDRFVAGDLTGGAPFAAPGSRRVLLATGSDAAATWTFADDAALGGTALAPFVPALTCPCDVGTDPTCGCVPHRVGYIDLKPSPTADTMALTMADDVEGHAVLTARFLALPEPGDPFASRE